MNSIDYWYSSNGSTNYSIYLKHHLLEGLSYSESTNEFLFLQRLIIA